MSYHLLQDYDMALKILEEFRKTQQVIMNGNVNLFTLPSPWWGQGNPQKYIQTFYVMILVVNV